MSTNEKTAPGDAVSTPPHPFRTAPWFDPRVVHQPCMCPKCRPPEDGSRLRLRTWRIVLVVIGGAVWPLSAMWVNTVFPVVGLRAAGTWALLLCVLATMANLVLLPTRRDSVSQRVELSVPRATWLRVMLLLGATWSCLCWGYLAVLMVPLMPISILLALWFGLGLCGLTPFVALAVSLVQLLRAYRVTAERLGRRAALVLTVAGLVLPLLTGLGVGLLAWHRQVWMENKLAAIAVLPPHSEERLYLVAKLSDRADLLPASVGQITDVARRRAAAEAYLLLTDRRLSEAIPKTRRSDTMIRPLWFLDGHDSPINDYFGGHGWSL